MGYSVTTCRGEVFLSFFLKRSTESLSGLLSSRKELRNQFMVPSRKSAQAFRKSTQRLNISAGIERKCFAKMGYQFQVLLVSFYFYFLTCLFSCSCFLPYFLYVKDSHPSTLNLPRLLAMYHNGWDAFPRCTAT